MGFKLRPYAEWAGYLVASPSRAAKLNNLYHAMELGRFWGLLHLFLSIIIFISYVKFINCVDPFHEVKSKREKKKEVRAFVFLKYVMSFSFQISSCTVMFVLVLLKVSIFDLKHAQLACFFIQVIH